MDTAYFSAFVALAGSVIGGATSLGASWLTQQVQFRAQQYTRELSRREDLYKAFIEEASRLYADAYENNGSSVSKLVNLYALISRMRVLSSPSIVETADQVARVIIDTYRAPNKTFRDVAELLNEDAMNPLRDFSNACREERHQQSA